MRKLWLVLGAAAGLSIAVVAIGDPQTGCTVWVEPGASLQAAIAAAPPGAVICLPQGSWEENLIITKSVTIRGQGAERTRISWSGGTDPFFISQPVIWIKGEGEPITVIIEDLAIQGPPGSGSWWGLPHGLVAQGTAWVEVRGVRVSGNPGIGIWLSESAQGAIRDTAVLENEHGVLLSDEAQATLEGVRAAHNRMHNIALGGASRARITNSIVEEAGFYGVTVGEQAQLTLSECQLIGGANGLVVAGEAEAVVNNCLIKNAEFDGVLLMGSPQLRLFRSTITG
ncbi:MAG TPA: hypothetical protein ENI38_03765, partial [Candidatus Acetothermia bacterium]|nr:hypothetical protein [Candidatus Acetothermia bacterium]